MEYRHLGRSGLQVSVVGLGCNNFGTRVDLDQARSVVHAAIDLGITFFDTADVYGSAQGNVGGSETILGELLAQRRDDVVIATKFGYYKHDMGYGRACGAKGSRPYIRRALDASLRRLRTDHVDLYQLHSPDPGTPMVETLAALHELVLDGKVGYLGHSNFSAWQLAEADHLARENGFTPFISSQNRWSLLDRSWEAVVRPAAEHYGLSMIPHTPLAQGLLTGKVKRGHPAPAGSRVSELKIKVDDDTFQRLLQLENWAASNGRSLLQVAFGALVALSGSGLGDCRGYERRPSSGKCGGRIVEAE